MYVEDKMPDSIRRLFKDGYDTADWLLAGLVRTGIGSTLTRRILDFGCGAGELVYRFRDLGFEAYGFDIHDEVKLRTPEDRKYFGFAPQNSVTDGSQVVRPEDVRTPFADDSFDLIVSTSVLEHVLDHDPLMAETARVLKPHGVAIHVYPGRTSFIEPHIYVPLGTRVQNWWWLYFWAHFGGTSDFHRPLTARQSADKNLHYCHVALSYPHEAELIAIAGRHFDDVRMVTGIWHSLSLKDRLMRPKFLLNDMRKWHPLKAISMRQLLDVMLTADKKKAAG